MAYLITWLDKDGKEHDSPIFIDGTIGEHILFLKKYVHPKTFLKATGSEKITFKGGTNGNTDNKKTVRQF